MKVAAAATTADKIFDRVEAAQAEEEDDYLDPEVAFVLTAEALSTSNIRLNWRIADGYYLYKQRIKLEPADTAQPVGAIVLPKGESHTTNTSASRKSIGTVSTHRSRCRRARRVVDVKVTYQGCADAGLCYPPITKTDDGLARGRADRRGQRRRRLFRPAAIVSEQDSFAAKITGGSIFLPWHRVYLGAGCCWPSRPACCRWCPFSRASSPAAARTCLPRRGFMLSVVLRRRHRGHPTARMGVLAATSAAASICRPCSTSRWILIPFALLFVVLASSMFGAFTIEMPSFIQSRLSDASNQQRAGTFIGVGVMGALSALIVSACVAPVLIGALTFIAKTGDMTRGGLAHAVDQPRHGHAAAAGRRVRRERCCRSAGAWMETIKNLFGVMFLAVAVWLRDPHRARRRSA